MSDRARCPLVADLPRGRSCRGQPDALRSIDPFRQTTLAWDGVDGREATTSRWDEPPHLCRATRPKEAPHVRARTRRFAAPGADAHPETTSRSSKACRAAGKERLSKGSALASGAAPVAPRLRCDRRFSGRSCRIRRHSRRRPGSRAHDRRDAARGARRAPLDTLRVSRSHRLVARRRGRSNRLALSGMWWDEVRRFPPPG